MSKPVKLRRVAQSSIERLGLPQPESVIQPEKTLYVEKCPKEMSPRLAACHVLRTAVFTGCSKISVKRGRWRYEFNVKDMLPRQMASVAALGPSPLSMRTAGYEFGQMKDPGQQVLVRPPWNQGV